MSAPPRPGEGIEGRRATRAAAALMKYWRDRGYPEVTAHPEMVAIGDPAKRPAWGIRSNLVNGLPPSMKGRWCA